MSTVLDDPDSDPPVLEATPGECARLGLHSSPVCRHGAAAIDGDNRAHIRDGVRS